jgi:thiamine phosphate synthase YjbQ (UPF0047 family)
MYRVPVISELDLASVAKSNEIVSGGVKYVTYHYATGIFVVEGWDGLVEDLEATIEDVADDEA